MSFFHHFDIIFCNGIFVGHVGGVEITLTQKLFFQYAFAEGGAHLPIAHALRPPEPTQKTKSSGCVPPLCSGPLVALRFGRRKVSGRKEKRKRKKE